VGCGCGGRKKVAVTSVNAADLYVEQQNAEEALRRDMASLVAAVHNANSTVVEQEPTM
jgi:hypothetical protein